MYQIAADKKHAAMSCATRPDLVKLGSKWKMRHTGTVEVLKTRLITYWFRDSTHEEVIAFAGGEAHDMADGSGGAGEQSSGSSKVLGPAVELNKKSGGAGDQPKSSKVFHPAVQVNQKPGGAGDQSDAESSKVLHPAVQVNQKPGGAGDQSDAESSKVFHPAVQVNQKPGGAGEQLPPADGSKQTLDPAIKVNKKSAVLKIFGHSFKAVAPKDAGTIEAAVQLCERRSLAATNKHQSLYAMKRCLCCSVHDTLHDMAASVLSLAL